MAPSPRHGAIVRSGDVSVQVEDLDHVALSVSDLAASVRFYRDLLGLPELERPRFPFAGAWFALGGRAQLHLIVGDGDPGSGAPRGSHFALRVDDLDAVSAHLSAHGIAHEVRRRPDGAAQTFIRDPDGHWIEFTSPPD